MKLSKNTHALRKSLLAAAVGLALVGNAAWAAETGDPKIRLLLLGT